MASIIQNYKKSIINTKEKGINMNKINLISTFIIAFYLAGCAPSPQSIQQAIEQTQTAMPTIEPTFTPKPTEKLTTATTPQIEKTLDATIIGLSNIVQNLSDVESVTTFRIGEVSFEVELRTKWASKENQSNTSFEVIQVLSHFFGALRNGQDLYFVKGQPDQFSILLTTYSIDGKYKYSSLTYYDALVKLYNKQMTYDEWVKESGANFVN